MSSQRIRFNRSLFTTPLNAESPQQIIAELAAEDIELVLDVRAPGGADLDKTFDALCANAEMYYVRRPGLDAGSAPDTAWAAGLALRHRTCILGDPDEARLATSRAIAEAGGMRVIDIAESPAPITRTGRPPQRPT